jgi:hypothetical protein
MEGVVEGVGEVVSGGLVARAVEPEAGEHHGAAATCLNCRTPLVGEFCHRCGQSGHIHRTLSAFGHDLLHGVLHFEGKIWRTLPMLALHPGRLTRRYIEGERAAFVSPMALFLFSVFLMFAVINSIGAPVNLGSGSTRTSAEQRADALRDYQQEQAEDAAKLKELTAELERTRAAGGATAGIEQRIAGVRQAMRLQKAAYELETRLANEEEVRERDDAAGPAKGEIDVETSGDVKFKGSSVQWLNDAYKKAKENPSLLIYKLQSNAYKFSWALIPISLPFVWMLFLHRRRYRERYKAYDHVVFVTYSIAFMSLGFVVLSVLSSLGLGGGLAALVMTVVPPVHMYRQLRGAYDLSRFSALWRTFMLVNFTFITTGIFLTLLLMMGVLG